MGYPLTQVIDSSGDGTHSLSQTQGVAVDVNGDVFVAGGASHNVFKITPGGIVTQIIDNSGDGTHGLACLNGIAVDTDGSLLVPGFCTNNLFKIVPGGTILQIIDETGDGTHAFTSPSGVAARNGKIYASSSNNNVFRTTAGDIGAACLCGSDCHSGLCDGVCVTPICGNDGPATGCLTAQKSLLLVKHRATDGTKDKLIWKWIKGDALDPMDLADPTGSDRYGLCVYVGGGTSSVVEADLPLSRGWSVLGSKGYKFKGTSPDGLTLALLKGGAAGKSKALAKGKGANLPDPTLPLAYPVTVQLKKDGSPLCLESTFTSANEKKNDVTQFKAIQ